MFRLRTVFYLQPTYAVIAFRLLDTALDVNILLLAERYMPLIENSLQIIAMDKMMPVEVVAVIQVDTQILDHGCIKILLLVFAHHPKGMRQIINELLYGNGIGWMQ